MKISRNTVRFSLLALGVYDPFGWVGPWGSRITIYHVVTNCLGCGGHGICVYGVAWLHANTRGVHQAAGDAVLPPAACLSLSVSLSRAAPLRHPPPPGTTLPARCDPSCRRPRTPRWGSTSDSISGAAAAAPPDPPTLGCAAMILAAKRGQARARFSRSFAAGRKRAVWSSVSPFSKHKVWI